MKPLPTTSPTGWWIVGLLERRSDPDGAPYWNNYRIIKAEHWRTAYQRAIEFGKSDCEMGIRVLGHNCELVGVTDLVPIYEKFEDGAEILWEELWPKDDEVPLETFTETELSNIYQVEPTVDDKTSDNSQSNQ